MGSQSGDDELSGDEEDGPVLVRFGTSGKSLKDELADLVSEDPDAAANVLRNWIGHVSNAA
jgi:flagellar biosynthesis/type III secretory pathway M-ring protein FliF/YscJ